MVNKSLRKNIIREIRLSFGRFLAILSIVALGVGFFSGLQVTKSSMLSTGQSYFDEKGLYDLRLISEVGLTEEDLVSVRNLDFVERAEGAYSTDVLATTPEGSEIVAKLFSYSESINQVTLTAGRLPENASECIADSKWFSEEYIGKTITISDENSENTLDMLENRELTVVGLCKAVTYVNFERGTTGLGTGKITGFLVVLPEEFTCDYFTEIYAVTNASSEKIYSQAYDDLIETQTDIVKPRLQVWAKNRYDKLYAEAEEKIQDAQAEIDDADSQIAEAKEKLADAEEEIADGEKEIAENEEKIADAEKKVADGEKEITDNEKKISDGEKELADAKEKLADAKKELAIAKSDYYTLYNMQQDTKAKIDDLKKTITTLPPYLQAEYYIAIATYESIYAAYGEVLREARTKIDENEILINDADKELSEKEAELNDAIIKISDAKKKISDAKTDIEDGKIKIEEGKEDISDAKVKLSDAKEELAEHEGELNDAKIKLADAKDELADFTEPEVYVLTRNTNIGYACFENDSKIVEGIGNVFPIFFFLVAALVCMTTMSRMVEEQRTQIGVMKALGYSESAIMGKYLVYSGSAAMIGGIAGFFAGSKLFPYVIWNAYKIMYTMKPIDFVFDTKLAVISLIVSVLCSMGATYFTLSRELKSHAADLIRPKAPKNGKRVFLEKIGFIWNHLKFTSKVSIRNAFRYKKRFFMMILGVGGCYSLLITGMGIKDSIADVCDCQFKNIQKYDMTVTFKDNVFAEERSDFLNSIENSDYIYCLSKTVDVVAGNKLKSATMVIFSDEEAKSGSDYINFLSPKDEPLSLPDRDEVILTEKMARMLGITVGDTVILRDPDLNEIKVTVSAITKNYVNNWAYISPGTYSSQMKHTPYYNTALIKNDSSDVAVALRNLDIISSVSISEETSRRINSMMESLNQVVMLVILSAAALAFIVMYNLTNINITERLREIATLKVLGFYPLETALYVFRENLILTALGIVVGLFMGKWLHAYVMYNINVEVVTFDTKILPVSYVYGVVFTFIFALIVDLILSVKLEKIKMAESLKSVE